MDIQIFVNRRKELGLSQIELSEGICTQKVANGRRGVISICSD